MLLLFVISLDLLLSGCVGLVNCSLYKWHINIIKDLSATVSHIDLGD